jgi:hypothetical protein
MERDAVQCQGEVEMSLVLDAPTCHNHGPSPDNHRKEEVISIYQTMRFRPVFRFAIIDHIKDMPTRLMK